ncbi:MAG TPA: sialate O-acetylesterase [Luteolibacter sp.]|nr:sialate O-acetylesterase [Luteolibacter sp.]
MKHKLLLAALLLFPLSHVEAKAKVFILSGQSNMSGGGHVVPEGLNFDPSVGDKVRIWDASDVWNKRGALGKWASLNELQAIKKEMKMDMIGPEFGFAKAMSELYPADQIHLIKVAKGGTPINFWLPDENGKPNGHTQLLENLKNALAKIEGEYEIKGMLWMQGESDAKQQADAEAYQKKLEQLIALMRKETGKPDLPFVIGRISSRILESKKFKMPFVKTVQSGQEAVTKTDKHAYVVDTDDLSQRDDLVHFDQQGQLGLGKRFGEAMIKALK